MFFDPMYFVYLAPAMLLGFWAQMRVKSTYASASQQPAGVTGAAAARRLLDTAGLHDVEIEPIAGEMTDHYDPRGKVLRLSEGVYNRRSLAAVGIAAHEAGHAIQDAVGYAPLVIRNLAVPAANFGGGVSWLLLAAGFVMGLPGLVTLGVVAFSVVVFFQLVNLPVEFDASNRAKRLLVEHQLVPASEIGPVRSVLNAAAWTYVAGTLQAVLTLLYLLMRFGGGDD